MKILLDDRNYLYVLLGSLLVQAVVMVLLVSLGHLQSSTTLLGVF
ncbi:MAG: hypothetical protein OXB98_19190 [Bryobacterales bacterium]|nr:hypothetical protein [Bryobacterales bacterium]